MQGVKKVLQEREALREIFKHMLLTDEVLKMAINRPNVSAALPLEFYAYMNDIGLKEKFRAAREDIKAMFSFKLDRKEEAYVSKVLFSVSGLLLPFGRATYNYLKCLRTSLKTGAGGTDACLRKWKEEVRRSYEFYKSLYRSGLEMTHNPMLWIGVPGMAGFLILVSAFEMSVKEGQQRFVEHLIKKFLDAEESYVNQYLAKLEKYPDLEGYILQDELMKRGGLGVFSVKDYEQDRRKAEWTVLVEKIKMMGSDLEELKRKARELLFDTSLFKRLEMENLELQELRQKVEGANDKESAMDALERIKNLVYYDMILSFEDKSGPTYSEYMSGSLKRISSLMQGLTAAKLLYLTETLDRKFLKEHGLVGANIGIMYDEAKKSIWEEKTKAIGSIEAILEDLEYLYWDRVWEIRKRFNEVKAKPVEEIKEKELEDILNEIKVFVDPVRQRNDSIIKKLYKLEERVLEAFSSDSLGFVDKEKAVLALANMFYLDVGRKLALTALSNDNRALEVLEKDLIDSLTSFARNVVEEYSEAQGFHLDELRKIAKERMGSVWKHVMEKEGLGVDVSEKEKKVYQGILARFYSYTPHNDLQEEFLRDVSKSIYVDYEDEVIYAHYYKPLNKAEVDKIVKNIYGMERKTFLNMMNTGQYAELARSFCAGISRSAIKAGKGSDLAEGVRHSRYLDL